MGSAALLATIFALIAAVVRLRLKHAVRNTSISKDLLRMPKRLTSLIWIAVAVGAGIELCRRIVEPAAREVLGFGWLGISEFSVAIGFGLIGAANLLDAIRLRNLAGDSIRIGPEGRSGQRS
jgi:hypothetical protein